MTNNIKRSVGQTTGGLSVFFTILCIVDLFGVFPVIALPKPIIACGIYGIPLVLSVFGLQLYTAMLLGRCWIVAQELTPQIGEKNRYPYAAVAELAFGRRARQLVVFLIDSTVFAAGVPNLLVGIYGIPLVLSVFGLQLYTAMLLGRCWIVAQELTPQIGEKNRYPYAAVAELAFGRRARQLVVFLIDSTVFAAGVPNLLVASQSLQLFWWKITGGGVGITFCTWMLLIGLLLCPVMWLGSPKDMKPLALFSVGIVTTVAIATWCCILQDTTPSPSSDLIMRQPSLQDFLVAYGIIAFQFDIHPMLLTIQVDMKNSSKVNLAVFGGFLSILFAVTSALAAYRYGQNVDSNILQGIPASIPLYVVALLVTLQLCLSSAVGNSALFQHIEDILRVPRDFCLQRCLIRSGIVALAVFLGESVPRFDLVMGLVGSTLTGPLMFIFPPLFFLKLCRMKTNRNEKNLNGDCKNESLPLILYKDYTTFSNGYTKSEYNIYWYDILLATSVMAVGVVATLIATYSNWSDAVNFANFSPPCFLNATAAARSFLQASKGF